MDESAGGKARRRGPAGPPTQEQAAPRVHQVEPVQVPPARAHADGVEDAERGPVQVRSAGEPVRRHLAL